MRQGLLDRRLGPLPFGAPPELAPGYLTHNVPATTAVANKTMAGAEIGKDLLVNMPLTNRPRGISINGGGGAGTCLLTGGSIDLRKVLADLAIRPLTIVGFKRIRIEGLILDPGTREADAFNWGGSEANPAIVEILNCRFEGTESESPADPVHSDLGQGTQPTAAVKIGRFTGRGSYQGLIGDGGADVPVGSWDIRQTDLAGWDDPVTGEHKLYGFPVYGWDAGDGFPCHFEDFYIDPKTSGRNPSTSLAHPPTSKDAEGFKTDDGGKTLYVNRPDSSGHITVGPPPGGAFVRRGDVGAGYVNTEGYA